LREMRCVVCGEPLGRDYLRCSECGKSSHPECGEDYTYIDADGKETIAFICVNCKVERESRDPPREDAH